MSSTVTTTLITRAASAAVSEGLTIIAQSGRTMKVQEVILRAMAMLPPRVTDHLLPIPRIYNLTNQATFGNSRALISRSIYRRRLWRTIQDGTTRLPFDVLRMEKADHLRRYACPD